MFFLVVLTFNEEEHFMTSFLASLNDDIFPEWNPLSKEDIFPKEAKFFI